jgi:hypothetical protein
MPGARNIRIEGNTFGGVGNVAVSANAGSTADLTIVGNVFLNLENTAVYIGCHDGSCTSTNLRFERNYINGVRAPEANAIGYGIEVKLNSWGVIRDNTIVRTKGPPIMTYGSNRGDPASLIEGNYVEGSRQDGGIVIGGGPAIVRNNIAVGNAYGGISIQNYGRRNLLSRVWVVHNTVMNNRDSGINVADWTANGDNVVAYNAILPIASTPAIRVARPGGIIAGNVAAAASDFVDATVGPYDLWPAAGGTLLDAVPGSAAPWHAADDFMGADRGERPDVGAMERTPQASDHRVGPSGLRPPRVQRR